MKLKIYCIGGSNTYGHDPRSYIGSRYPEEIRWTDRLKDCAAVNFGVNGMTVPNDAAYLIDAIKREESGDEAQELIVVMLGTNDLLEGKSAGQITDRMAEFLTSLSEANKPILLIAPPLLQSGEWVQCETVRAESQNLRERYHELAAKAGYLFADAGEGGIEMTFDGVHFSPAGHAAFAKKLENRIREAYATPK